MGVKWTRGLKNKRNAFLQDRKEGKCNLLWREALAGFAMGELCAVVLDAL